MWAVLFKLKLGGRMEKFSFVEISKKTRKIDKNYLSAIGSFRDCVKQKKRALVNRVIKEPKLLDTYDCLRLSADILENYARIVASASPSDNPKVIDYALPTLQAVEDAVNLVNEIDSSMSKKSFNIDNFKIKSKNCSIQLQESGKNYLTEFDAVVKKIPKDIISKAVAILNEEIGQEF